MTPTKARRYSTWWFVAGAALLVVQVTLDAVGIDELSLPLRGLSLLCCMVSARHSGWLSGYRDRGKEPA